jgi:hypothetical protein
MNSCIKPEIKKQTNNIINGFDFIENVSYTYEATQYKGTLRHLFQAKEKHLALSEEYLEINHEF